MSYLPGSDPASEQILAELLASAPPELVEWRRRELEDDDWQWYRDRYPDLIARWFEPQNIQWLLNTWDTDRDPYSPANIRLDAWLADMAAGAQVTVTDLATGEVVDEWETPGSAEGAAPQN